LIPNPNPGRISSYYGRILRILRILRLGPVLLLLAAGCYFDKEEKVENNLSFDRIADTLKQFDEVSIIVKKLNGETLDVIFQGKVVDTADVHNLKVPHWDGEKIIVSITGKKGGKTVYQVDTRLDAESEAREIYVMISPYASLSSVQTSLTLLVGDSLALPAIRVSPDNLLDKELEWSATPEGFLDVGKDFLRALQVEGESGHNPRHRGNRLDLGYGARIDLDPAGKPGSGGRGGARSLFRHRVSFRRLRRRFLVLGGHDHRYRGCEWEGPGPAPGKDPDHGHLPGTAQRNRLRAR
jgi:hypothetical protein